MTKLAVELGIDKNDILLDTKSMDTKDHARFIHKMIGNEKFILVTSALHMPRSVSIFHKFGMQPIPAPTDYMLKERRGGISPDMFFPSAGSLGKAQRAIHEYLGLFWAKIRGQI